MQNKARIKISVIIPSYKPKDYLWECLESLKKQSFSHSDFEIIVVLNGVKDPYCGLIQSFINESFDATYNIYLLYSEIGSVGNARNIGIDNASGEYITFIDDDDYVSESFLEELYIYANKDTVSLSHPVAFNETGILPNYSIEKVYLKVKDKDPVSFQKARRVFQGPCMKLFHRDIIGERRFDTSFKNGEDALFMFLISDNFKYIRATTSDAIYYRRVREDGAAYGKKSRWYLIRNSKRLIEKYCSIYCGAPLNYSFSFFITRIIGAMRMCLD